MNQENLSKARSGTPMKAEKNVRRKEQRGRQSIGGVLPSQGSAAVKQATPNRVARRVEAAAAPACFASGSDDEGMPRPEGDVAAVSPPAEVATASPNTQLGWYRTRIINEVENASAYRADNERLTSEGRKMYQAWAQKSTQLKLYLADLRSKTQELDRVQDELSAKSRDAERQRQKKAEQARRLRESSEAYKALRRDHDELRSKHDEALAELARLRGGEPDGLHGRIAQLRALVAETAAAPDDSALRIQNDILRREVASTEAERAALDAQLRCERAALAAASAEADRLRADVAAAERDLAAWAEREAAWVDEQSALLSQAEHARTERREETHQRIAALEAALEEHQAAAEDAQSRAIAAETALAAAADRLQAREAEARHMADDLATAYRRHKKQLEELEAEYRRDDYRARYEAAAAEAAALRARFDRLDLLLARTERLRRQHEGPLRAALAEARRRLDARAEDEAAPLRTQLRSAADAAAAQRARLAAASDQRQRLEAALRHSHEATARAVAAAKTLAADRDRRARASAMAEAEADRLRGVVDFAAEERAAMMHVLTGTEKNARERTDGLEHVAEALRSELAAAESARAAAEETAARRVEEAGEAHAIAERVSAELASLQAELGHVRDELASEGARRSEAATRAAELDGQCRDLTDTNASMLLEIEALRHDYAGADELEKVYDRVASLTADLEAARARVDGANAAAEDAQAAWRAAQRDMAVLAVKLDIAVTLAGLDPARPQVRSASHRVFSNNTAYDDEDSADDLATAMAMCIDGSSLSTSSDVTATHNEDTLNSFTREFRPKEEEEEDEDEEEEGEDTTQFLTSTKHVPSGTTMIGCEITMTPPRVQERAVSPSQSR